MFELFFATQITVNLGNRALFEGIFEEIFGFCSGEIIIFMVFALGAGFLMFFDVAYFAGELTSES